MSKYTHSWEGLEAEREEVRRLANMAVLLDAQADAFERARGGSTLGSICTAIRHPELVDNPAAVQAAANTLALRDLTAKLTQTHHVCGYLVRREYACIMDPRPEERALCDATLARCRHRR